MSNLATPLPRRRSGLVFSPAGDVGRYVVKDPSAGAYYHIGEEEYFLLTQLNGEQSAQTIFAKFAERFEQPLVPEELEEFLDVVQEQGLLQPQWAEDTADSTHQAPQSESLRGISSSPKPRSWSWQSILYWRINLFDPDRVFAWLEPKLWFFWTRTFVVLSTSCIVLAAAPVWLNRKQLAESFVHSLRWEMAVLAWLTILVVRILHESAHGLTCKHYGGEVREVGFLMMLLMPCFYCNVSDAWLFQERSKRLWVTFAGGYFELFLWALAAFMWRLTLPGSLPNDLAFVTLSACGIATLFNFNPLLKLDGYYLLSDWLEVPNLQSRSLGYFKGHLRWLLWGAAKPADERRSRLLLVFGLVSWLYSMLFLALMLWVLFQASWRAWGWLGVIGVALLGSLSARGVFRGVAAGEVRNMITTRHKRTVTWLLGLGGLAAVLCLGEMEDRVSGSFLLRPATRAELRARVAGFLKEVYCDDGDRVSPGELLARLEVPDLESRLAQKQAEVGEVRARLRLLEIGPRPEEVAEQRRRVERAKAWWDLAQHDLARKRQAFQDELASLDHQIAQHRAELDYAEYALEISRKLMDKGALSREQYREAEMKRLASLAQGEQAKAQRHARLAEGTLAAEAELARREKQWAEDRSTLALLELGTRLEEIDAARAHLVRLEEEARYLEGLRDKMLITTPVPGLVTTARVKEKVGQYLREGDVICVVEGPARLEAEIALAEQDVERVRAGQEVKLKARALPFQAFATLVDRIAPAAGRAEAQGVDRIAPAAGRGEGQTGRGEIPSSVTAYCRLDHAPAGLRPEMTGYARVYTGRRPIGTILLGRVLRFIRTEFWW